MASWTAWPSETTARAAFPGRRDPASAGLPSAVTGSGILVSSASRTTVAGASVFELAIGRYLDRGYRRHAGNRAEFPPRGRRPRAPGSWVPRFRILVLPGPVEGAHQS